MATFDSKSIIATILENNGAYPGDPQCETVWEYTTERGNKLYAGFWTKEHDMYESPYVINPTLFWSKETGLTDAGKEFLSTVSEPPEVISQPG